jgi:hypothetical protein
MQTTGQIVDLSMDFKTRKAKISLVLDTNELDIVEQLKNENKLNIEMKKWYKKRSLDANSYCWVICDLIAKELSKNGITTKEEIYKDAILQVGTFEPCIAQEKTFEKFKRIWEKQGLGFLVQEVSRKDECIKVNCYYGSSTYNSKEMSLLIEILVQLAKSLNIETKSKAEIDIDSSDADALSRVSRHHIEITLSNDLRFYVKVLGKFIIINGQIYIQSQVILLKDLDVLDVGGRVLIFHENKELFEKIRTQ